MKKLAALLLLVFVVMNCGFLAVNFHRDIPVDQLLPLYADPAASFLEVDGARLHLMDEGRRDGPPLLLIHGTGSSLHTWDGWVRSLREHFRLIRFDLPGFGLTGPNADDDYRLTRYVETARALLDALAIERIDIAGNSLGGHIAWRLALDHPERVGRLILIDAAGYASADGRPVNVLDAGRVPIVKSLLRKVTPRSMVEQGLREVFADDSKVTAALVERHFRLLLRAGNRDAMIARLNAAWEDRESDIPSIQHPTLVLWGAQDVWIPPTVGERFADEMLNAELIVYPDAGHVPMEELPDRSAADARAFLTRPVPITPSSTLP